MASVTSAGVPQASSEVQGSPTFLGTAEEGHTRTRDIRSLPKAHLHLHFTGSMTVGLLRRMSEEHGIVLNKELIDASPLRVPANRRGWFRFQRLYDMARRCVQTEQDMRTIVDEAARIDAAEGSRILEIQVTPDSYAKIMGGLTPALEVILDEAKRASERYDIAVGVIVAAARTHHPLEAKTLARLAAQYVGDEPGSVVGFGLSNDERSGRTSDFFPAFKIAEKAGLPLMPHAGELLGPEHIDEVLKNVHPVRIGHGVRAAENMQVVRRIVEAKVTLEVCPASNVGLGVYADKSQVPLQLLYSAGVHIALGADDPLLFGERLEKQYEDARAVYGFDDEAIAQLARYSLEGSVMAKKYCDAALTEVDEWIKSR
ncbi:MAG: adenosine deaminase [Bifidobacteriaceae bacterium]|nr:adenosine deaminase [Bifidobacteriaceae bacterium]MCI1979381.1 adenosine deaminase [Bifidobacteriaceae bacterium]